MHTPQRFHHNLPFILAAVGLLSACKGSADESSCPGGLCASADDGGAKKPTGSGGSKAADTAKGGSGGKSGSGGSGGAMPSNSGSGGQSDNTTGSGGASAGNDDAGVMGGNQGHDPMMGEDAAVDAGPPLADYTLVIDSPNDGTSVSGTVTVRGRAPAFVNVEIWDSMHQMPPLAQGEPDDDGNFELTVNVSTLATGMTTWTVHAWDSEPGESFDNEASATLDLTITAGGSGATTCAGQTCSGHGDCAVTGGSAACTCESDYHDVGLECIADADDDDGTADPGTKYVPSGYSLVFNDEFTSGTLDTSKWNTLGPWGVQFFEDSKQKQAFVPEAVTLSNGILSFTAKPSNGNSKADGQPYTSGSITTNRTFTHGYFETRAKVPSGKGFWPAYWLTSSERWPPEWDIFEIINNVIYGYPHPIKAGKCQFVEGAAGSDSTYTINNLYGIYHVYGFRWTATDTYWYVDGKLTEHYAVDSAAGANDPYWLNISFQIGGDWPGDPDNSTPFPAHMDVDYMRVYQD